MRLKNKLSYKIFGIALGILGLTVVVAYNSQKRLSSVKQEIHNLARFVIPITNLVEEINILSLEQEVHFERILKYAEIGSNAGAEIEHETQLYQQRRKEVIKNIAAAIDLARQGNLRASLPETRQKMHGLKPILEKIDAAHRKTHDHALGILAIYRQRSGNRRDYAQLSQHDELAQQLSVALESLFKETNTFLVDAARKSAHHQQRVLLQGSIVAVGAIVFGLVCAAMVTFGIVRPLRHLTRRVKGLTADSRETPEPLAVNSRDEVGVLSHTFNHMLIELDKKKALKNTFGKYLDPRVVSSIEGGGRSLTTTGEMQIVTVLMVKLHGFKPLATGLTPEQVVAVINQYLDLFSEPVSDHQGFMEVVETVIKAFWAQPFVPADQHAIRACRTALEQISKLELLRQSLRSLAVGQADIDNLDLRIGIATGPLVLANMGPKGARIYSVLGDTVNTAARLQGTAAQFGVQAIILEKTYQQLDDSVLTRELGLIQVVGKDEKLKIYELLGYDDETNTGGAEFRATFARGLNHYRQGQWTPAQKHFQTCLGLQPADVPTRKYLEQIEALRGQRLPIDWDGVWRLTKK